MTDSPPENTAAVELKSFGLRAGGRVLLDDVNVRIEPGQIVLIVGPSGVGKSLLLRALAGLIGDLAPAVATSGEVLVGTTNVLHLDGGSPGVGIVFQSYALFDELSPLENVRFSADHREHRSSPGPSVEGLLTELGVPRDVPTAVLSGGQRQRLAIARTLAYDPRVVLYDEPTSNLDAATAVRVAKLIEDTHRRHGKTSIVVTHDDRTLVPIADRVFLLDSEVKSLVEVPRDQWSALAQRMHPPELPPPPVVVKKAWWQRVPQVFGDAMVAASEAGQAAALFPLSLVPRWRSPAWGLRLLLHYLRLVADPSAWIYLAVAGSIAGFVATYFTFRYFPFRIITEPLIVEDLLRALGFILYRVMVPLLVTVLVAARCGAAVASDVGSKVYGRQVDAMRTFGARPDAYLQTNIIYAFLVGILVLNTIGFVAARLASLLVFNLTHPQYGPFYWKAHFYGALRHPGDWTYDGTLWLVAKLLVCAAGMAVIAYRRGMRPKQSSTDVSLGITSTVLWSTLFVLVVHLGFALFEFE